jgi:hypothetical protein
MNFHDEILFATLVHEIYVELVHFENINGHFDFSCIKSELTEGLIADFWILVLKFQQDLVATVERFDFHGQ